MLVGPQTRSIKGNLKMGWSELADLSGIDRQSSLNPCAGDQMQWCKTEVKTLKVHWNTKQPDAVFLRKNHCLPEKNLNESIPTFYLTNRNSHWAVDVFYLSQIANLSFDTTSVNRSVTHLHASRWSRQVPVLFVLIPICVFSGQGQVQRINLILSVLTSI